MALKSDNFEILASVDKIDSKPTIAAPRKYKILYSGLITIIYMHLASIYGIYLLTKSVKKETILFNFIIYILAGIGVTAGAHRLWSHRSFKAKLPLQIILMLFHSMSFQYSALTWAKQHRLHHKYSDTDADPHNASRGFFFSHVGWMMVYAHDEVRKRLRDVDISDIAKNPILKFQKKYAYPLIGSMCFLLPTLVSIFVWGETFNNAWHISVLRYALNLHASFLINSAAHKFGSKPYDTNILPTQNHFVSLVICGEGFHNYHHSFPWDYRAAELGNNFLNLSSLFIDLCAYIGWAYDLKIANPKTVRTRAIRTGDGSDSWGRVKKSITTNYSR